MVAWYIQMVLVNHYRSYATLEDVAVLQTRSQYIAAHWFLFNLQHLSRTLHCSFNQQKHMNMDNYRGDSLSVISCFAF